MSAISFNVQHTSGAARAAILTTPHGDVPTPAFMPVATPGSVKAVTPQEVRELGSHIILANAYHLYLRPGPDTVERLGGLHAFMGWDGPILTDSGGFQVFSLGGLRRVTDAGVEFTSHLDGSLHVVSPEDAMRYQEALGVDIAMVLDQCPAYGDSDENVRIATERTHLWAERCRTAHIQRGQALFGIVQGGHDLELRAASAERLTDIGFDGYAVGGLSVGETHEEMVSVLGPAISALPPDRPRYLMGVGMPRDLLAAVQAGVDLFDCVLPTRNGRNSQAFSGTGTLNLRNERYRLDSGPLEADCDCETCGRFSRGYIRHLFNAGEMLGPTLTSIHNLRFYQRFMTRIRELIREGGLARIVTEFPIAAGPAQHQQEESP